MQVVTAENFGQLVETGKVDEYVPPAAPEAKAEAKAEEKKAEVVDKPLEKDDKSSATAKVEDDDDKDLTEKVRQKIGAKHRQMKEAEEFGKAQYLERRAAEQRADELQRKLQDIEAKSRPVTVEAKEPKPEDFATVAEYTDALTDFKLDQKWKKKEADETQRKIDEVRAQQEQEFSKRITKATEQYPDFQEKVQALSGSEADKVHVDVLEYIKESDVGANLLYHLATNRDDLERLNKLSPRKFIAELGKLEVRFEKKAEVASDAPKLSSITTTVSKAPAPIVPIDASKSTVVEKDPAKMTFQELREYERQRAANKRR